MIETTSRSEPTGGLPSQALVERKASEWSARLDGLIGMLSHDLRTPLSAISGWLFLLESGKLDAQAQKRAIAKIKASIEEQVQLIDDTLLISRSETGGVELERSAVDVREAVIAAVEHIRAGASAKGVTVDVGTIDDGLCIDAEAPRLQRALELLVAHALKATPSGGRVEIEAASSANAVRIRIADTGAGIAAADLPFVLDPFRRMADGGIRSTRGIDRQLLLAQALIIAHGGTLALASAGPGCGETFTIELPCPGPDGEATT